MNNYNNKYVSNNLLFRQRNGFYSQTYVENYHYPQNYDGNESINQQFYRQNYGGNYQQFYPQNYGRNYQQFYPQNYGGNESKTNLPFADSEEDNVINVDHSETVAPIGGRKMRKPICSICSQNGAKD